MKQASQSLGEVIGQQVIPIILFPTKKLASIYKENREQRTRVMHVLEIEDYFKKRRSKLEKAEREQIEKQVFEMIVPSPPIP